MTTTPNNLPRLQPFFGREAELKQIHKALDPAERTWGALIDGPGGMGKTSLAIRAAYDCPPGLFDRILFTSVKDRELDDDGERYLDARLIPGFIEMLNDLARKLKPDARFALANTPHAYPIQMTLQRLDWWVTPANLPVPYPSDAPATLRAALTLAAKGSFDFVIFRWEETPAVSLDYQQVGYVGLREYPSRGGTLTVFVRGVLPNPASR